MDIFGQLPAKPTAIANEIIDKVRGLAKDGRADWNKAVKNVLRKLGHDKGYSVYPDPENGNRGWLLDLVWLDRTGAIRLALESELGKEGEVFDDFQKLLCIKAPLKVMVYYVYGKNSFLDKFEAYLKEFDQHVCGEHYLLIEFAPGPNDQGYLFSVKKDRTISRRKALARAARRVEMMVSGTVIGTQISTPSIVAEEGSANR